MARAVVLFVTLGALGGCLARAPMYLAQGAGRMLVTSQVAARATAHAMQSAAPMMARATARTAQGLARTARVTSRAIGHAIGQPVGCRSVYECGPPSFEPAYANEPVETASPQVIYVYVTPDAPPAWQLPRY